jgi:hypothetical protein
MFFAQTMEIKMVKRYWIVTTQIDEVLSSGIEESVIKVVKVAGASGEFMLTSARPADEAREDVKIGGAEVSAPHSNAPVQSGDIFVTDENGTPWLAVADRQSQQVNLRVSAECFQTSALSALLEVADAFTHEIGDGCITLNLSAKYSALTNLLATLVSIKGVRVSSPSPEVALLGYESGISIRGMGYRLILKRMRYDYDDDYDYDEDDSLFRVSSRVLGSDLEEERLVGPREANEILSDPMLWVISVT